MPLRAAPQVIVHPPQEEEEEPCLSYCAPEEPAGLSNPLKLRTLSLTHAILQVLMALPETTEELPVESNHEPTRLFTNLIRQIHTSPTAEPLDLSWILSETNLITTTATEISSVEKYDSVLRYMLATLLGPTKMGQRFHLETITIDNLASASESLTNLYSTSTAASLPSLDSQTNTLNNSLSQLAPVREPFVTLPLEKYAEHESVALVDLLRSHFGIPQPAQFYFGGNTSGSTKNLIFSNPDLSAKSTSASQQQQKLLTKVPTLLPLLFHRPLSASKNVFHRTSVEVPLEIDIGFLVHPQTLVAAQKEHRCNHRVGTYFRLYGFVTQTEGRFITYTRCGSIWGEDLFWKCEDEVVSGPIELGTRVNSKGIVIALYRAEIKARG